MDANIRKAGSQDIELLLTMQPEPDKLFFEECFERDCDIYIISLNEQPAGYGILNWSPKYSLYERLDYPEIQDLNIVAEYRQKGLATKLIGYMEDLVQKSGKEGIGISVGVSKEFGSAQRLYIKLGFIPDGLGITRNRQSVPPGSLVPVDPDLCLMLLKLL